MGILLDEYEHPMNNDDKILREINSSKETKLTITVAFVCGIIVGMIFILYVIGL